MTIGKDEILQARLDTLHNIKMELNRYALGHKEIDETLECIAFDLEMLECYLEIVPKKEHLDKKSK